MEIWKDIKNFEGLYQVSDNGRIKSLKNNIILKDRISSYGYYQLSLSKNNKNYYLCVHKLIAQTFLENPLNKKQVNHIDGNKLNNNLINLEWVTCGENHKHAFKIGLRKKWMKGESHPKAKLTQEKANFIRKSKIKGIKLAEFFKVSTATISLIRNNKIWI